MDRQEQQPEPPSRPVILTAPTHWSSRRATAFDAEPYIMGTRLTEAADDGVSSGSDSIDWSSCKGWTVAFSNSKRCLVVRDRRHLFHDQIIVAAAQRDRWAALVRAFGLPTARDSGASVEDLLLPVK